METRTLGGTGLEVSVLGFGAAVVAYLDTDRAQASAVIDRLLDSGVNLFDTAASYPDSEQFLGEFLIRRGRGNVVLVSKCGMKIPGSDAPEWSEKLILDSIDRSRRLLGIDPIDVMLLHSCDLARLRKGEALGALAKAREAGLIRFAGYSGDNDAAAYAAAHPLVDVIETSISFLDQHNIDAVLPAARQHNKGVLAKRPVANAAWKDPSQQPGMYRSYAKPYTDRFRALNLEPAGFGYHGDPQQVWPEIALRFTLSFPQVHSAIIGTSNPENAMKNVTIANKGPLPNEIVQKLRHAFRRADPHRTWLGQT